MTSHVTQLEKIMKTQLVLNRFKTTRENIKWVITCYNDVMHYTFSFLLFFLITNHEILNFLETLCPIRERVKKGRGWRFSKRCFIYTTYLVKNDYDKGRREVKNLKKNYWVFYERPNIRNNHKKSKKSSVFFPIKNGP